MTPSACPRPTRATLPPDRTPATAARQVASIPTASTAISAAPGGSVACVGEDGRGAQPLGEGAPLVHRLRAGDAGSSRDRRVDGEGPDRAAADHEQAVARLDAVDPERRERRRQRLDEHRNVGVETLRHGDERVRADGNALGEDALAVETEEAASLAQVLLPAAAGAAGAADDQGEDDEAARPTLDAPQRFVAEDERRDTGARVAAVGVEVGTADPGELDLEQNLSRAGLGLGHRLDLEAVVSVPDESPHVRQGSPRRRSGWSRS